jgi:hypothetical protein
MSEPQKFSLDEIKDYLVELGKIICVLLEVLPSNEVSIAVKVADDCVLEFTIAKK